MTLKHRLSIYTASIFSLIFCFSWILVYVLFADFRSEEFRDRLEEKALTTAKLLLEVQEVDENILKLIEQNTVNKLYNEKILIFDEKFNLIYSSIGGVSVEWSPDELLELKKERKIFKADKQKDVLGIFYDFEKADYYVLISAEDIYGNKKLSYLFYSLLITFLISTALVWFFTYRAVERQLYPLKKFEIQISAITANELNTRIQETSSSKEIQQITHAFNLLLERVDRSFELQKEFTTNASHELRTPISRLLVQVENLANYNHLNGIALEYLKNITGEVSRMSQIIGSLMVLARDNQNPALFTLVRIDEILFSAYKKIKESWVDTQFFYQIDEGLENEEQLMVKAHASILEIAFVNLLKNAAQYGNEKKIYAKIGIANEHVKIEISNRGEPLNEQEQEKIFSPFVRGSNSAGRYGSGLGLHITKRILDFHGFNISYRFEAPDEHIFLINCK